MRQRLRWPYSYRYLTRLNAPASEADNLRTERALGLARAVLSGLMLLAIYVDSRRAASSTPLLYETVGAWVFYSCALVIWLYYQEDAPPIRALHLFDLLWIILITSLTQGPFFTLFTFSLVAAGFRWGLPETMGTAAINIIILNIEAFFGKGTTASFHDLLQGQFEVNRFIVRCVFLVVLGMLIGVGAENEKERRAEAAMVNRLLHSVRPEAGLTNSLQIVLSEFARLFSAKRAYVAIKELTTDRVLVWHLDVLSPNAKPHMREIPSGEADGFLLRELPRTFYCRQLQDRAQLNWWEGGSVHTREMDALPYAAFRRDPVQSMVCVASEMGNEWFARLVLIDARVGERRERELGFAESLARQATSALYSLFLIRRLRSRAGAMERARVARELHDGAIQSMISAEMRVDVLRRRAERGSSELEPELSELQHLLRREVLNLRELMQQMRPVDLIPEQLLDYIADTVDRFRRDTGIDARFVSDLQEVDLSPHICRELVRIVQEGLVNIRKHSQATHAIVGMTRCESGALRLTISDNGRGFEFEGLISSEELANTTKGPMIIKERVRGIGGQLSIESNPGRGSRLDITLPPKGKSAHG
ncbi:MAG: sensor histidine kinase [Candidatus Korobacteraceae bacterium]